MTDKAEFFVAENALLERREELLSPSGKYKLVVTPFSTKKGSWNYTQGLVYAVGSDDPIADVQRNYRSFPHTWVEGHSNGHSYLVCGEDYQGQTVIELDTGKRRDHLSDGTEKGHGFCWVSCRYDETTSILIVAGCIWACPYEYRFFDFADPMEGWPQLRVRVDGEDSYVDEDPRWPTSENGLIKVYQTECDEDGDHEDNNEKLYPVAAHTIFKRVGNTLEQHSFWVSEKEQTVRKDREEAQVAYEAKLAKWKAEDPLYLAHRELLKDPVLSPSPYASRGITHEGWSPDFKIREPRWCQDIVTKHPTYSVGLEWATETGPVKLIVRKDKKSETLWFEHSVEGMEKAYAHTRGLVS